MKKLLQNVLFFILFTEGGASPLLGQTELYRGWSEPLFNDNAAEFDAGAGSFECTPYFGAFRSPNGLGYDSGGEIEAVLSKKWAIETGFYYTWFQAKERQRQKTENEFVTATRAAFSGQYIFKNTINRVWAVGTDMLAPGWSSRGQQQTTGWGFKPNLIYGQRWRNGVDCQWRITPSFEYWKAVWRIGGTLQGAYFWQNDWLNMGIEVGGGKEAQPLAFVAPQVGVYLGNFSLWLGWWKPTYFQQAKAVGYLSFSLSYHWGSSE